MNYINILTKIQELKSQLDKLRPFDKEQLKNLKQRFRIGFIHHTNAIEWNTLTLTEVKVLLEDGITIGGKTVAEIQETINHNQIMGYLWDWFVEKKNRCSEQFIKKMHSLLFQQILPKKSLWEYRSIKVYISWTDEILPDPSELNQLIFDFITKFEIIDSLEDIAKLHWEFVKIHPFVDGNGRIARLLMNLWLIHLWYFPIVIPMICRANYIHSLTGKNFITWYEFFLDQVYENHKDYVRFLKN